MHRLKTEFHCKIALLCMFSTQFKNRSRTYADALGGLLALARCDAPALRRWRAASDFLLPSA